MEADSVRAFTCHQALCKRLTRRIPVPSAEAHRLVTQKRLWKTGPSNKALRIVVDETRNGPITEIYRLFDDETPSFASS